MIIKKLKEAGASGCCCIIVSTGMVFCVLVLCILLGWETDPIPKARETPVDFKRHEKVSLVKRSVWNSYRLDGTEYPGDLIKFYRSIDCPLP